MVFSHAEEFEPDLIGQDGLCDDIPQVCAWECGWPFASSVTSPKVSSPSSIASAIPRVYIAARFPLRLSHADARLRRLDPPSQKTIAKHFVSA